MEITRFAPKPFTYCRAKWRNIVLFEGDWSGALVSNTIGGNCADEEEED